MSICIRIAILCCILIVCAVKSTTTYSFTNYYRQFVAGSDSIFLSPFGLISNREGNTVIENVSKSDIIALMEEITMTPIPTERRGSFIPSTPLFRLPTVSVFQPTRSNDRYIVKTIPPMPVTVTKVNQENNITFIEQIMEKHNLSYKKPLLAVSTTLIASIDSAKLQIQKNCLKVLNSFYPFVQTVVFDTTGVVAEWGFKHISVVSNPEVNPHRTPFFKPMVQYMEKHYDSAFYGYCNGDLLFHSDLIRSLHSLSQQINNGTLKSSVFFVGRRVNYDHLNIQALPDDIETVDNIISNMASKGYLFQTDAQDYFFYTKHSLIWKYLIDVVIGRPGYDNYLVDFVYHHRHEIDLIDTTNASRCKCGIPELVLIVHQTDKDGSKAGFRNNPDINWNLDRIGKNWYMGRTEYCPYGLERTKSGSILLQQHAINGVTYNDNYLEQELDIFRRYINHDDVCLHYSHRAIKGTLLDICKSVITVFWDGRIQLQMQRKFDREERMRIEYAHGHESRVSNQQMQSINTFKNYISIAELKRFQFDVVINDGHVKPQIAYELRNLLKPDGIMFVLGTSLEGKQHYQVIKQFYSVVEEITVSVVPGQEFSGITVFRNSVKKTSFVFPPWW